MSLPVTIEGKRTDAFKQRSAKGPYMLGTRMVYPDGRVYRYCRAGASNITIGRVIGAQAVVSTLAIDNLISGAGARTTAQWDAGTQTVLVATTASATSANQINPNRFDDGYLWVTDQTGEGQLLQIKSHGISTSSGSTGVTFTMHDEDLLTIALTTNTQVGLFPNLYSKVRIHTGTTGGGPALGVAPIVVTALYYFWAQTWGPCPVISGVTLPLAGEVVGVVNTTGGSTGATGVAGSIYPMHATKYIDDGKQGINAPKIGFCLVPAVADADFSLVYLTIAP